MSLAVSIADAVTQALNTAPAGTFAQTFTAVRQVLPVHELSDLAELKVTVVPKGIEITGSTRSLSQYEVSVDIGIQQKLAPGSAPPDSVVIQLGGLVDEIADYLRQHPLSLAPHARWVRTVNDPIYAPEHLLEQRVFTSLLTLTYRLMK